MKKGNIYILTALKKIKMKRLLILLATAGCYFSTAAQSISGASISSGGDYFNTPNARLSSSTGELITGLKKNGNAMITQGFEQATYSYWNGKVSPFWQNPLNWNGPLPGMNTDIIVISPVLNNIIVNSNAGCRRLFLRPGSAVTVNSGFSLMIQKQ